MRVSDILAGSKWCRSCAISIRMAKLPPEVRVARAVKASAAASAVNRAVRAPYGAMWSVVYRRMLGAYRRCKYKSAAWVNYGGRGIEFRFATPVAAAVWVLDNLGPPSGALSLDRIDNNGHYEPGNLRWATKEEQARNKRQYKVSIVGARLRRLRVLRGDLTYETIRTWIKKGLSDDEIINRRKHLGCGVRHT